MINAEEILMSIFATRMVLLRKEKGMTQQEMANIFQKSRQAISSYETQEREPEYDFLCKMADYFDVSSDYLLGRTNDRNPKNDTVINDFNKNYDLLPITLKNLVSDTYSSIFSLLEKAVKNCQEEYLIIYRDFFVDLKNIRAELQSRTENAAGSAAEMAELFALESKAKELMTSTLDKLMQLDLDAAASKESKKKIG